MIRRAIHSVRRPAFSLQEVMVAVGILGVGLILVASIFPFALAQHRDAVEGTQSITLAHRAQAVMETKVNRNFPLPANAPGFLWQPVGNGTLPGGTDSPWLALPAYNIDLMAGPSFGLWVPLGGPGGYLSVIDNLILPPPAGGPQRCSNPLFWGPADQITDARLPLNDAEAEESPYRLAWYGFYRELSDGRVEYATAVCRQKRTDTYIAQNLSDLTPAAVDQSAPAFLNPTVDINTAYRMPLPWRVSVSYTGGRVLSFQPPLSPVAPPATATVEVLFPSGSRIAVMGTVYGPSPRPSLPAGRVLTVNQSSAGAISVLEDISDLPGGWIFDVWVFPPTFAGGIFGKKSPVLDWIFF